MAGGAGTRLWPMSRRNRPKQLLPIIGGSKSLLQLAAARLEGIVPPDRRLICTNESHRTLIRSSMPQFEDRRILGEPMRRDTLNAIGYTAAVLNKEDPDAIFAVLTADHIIEPQDEFKRKLQLGFELIEDDPERFVTFSIMPTHAATSYGYVERGAPLTGFEGAYEAKRFVEKPDKPTAESYIASGNFNWNSGMFVFHAGQFLQAVERFKPRAAQGLDEIAGAWGTNAQEATLKRVYDALPEISVDYAIMEPAADDEAIKVCTVAMGVWWTDVGSWPTFGESLPADNCGCRTNTRTVHMNSHNILAVSEDPEHTIATVDCNDLIVVHTHDVTMVCPASSAQRVKELAESMPEGVR
jgi:mannose-1-phosphate guanylyltransferase